VEVLVSEDSNVVRLHSGEAYEPPGEVAQIMLRNAGLAADEFGQVMVGFVIVTLHEDGTYGLSSAVDTASFAGPTMLAALAKAAIDRDMLAAMGVRDALAEPI
jgi:hypothetical protein